MSVIRSLRNEGGSTDGRSPDDWTRFSNGLLEEKLALPLTKEILLSLPQDSPLHAEFRTRINHLVNSNLLMTAELLRVIELLDRSGIQAIPFKGPVLSVMLYGSIGSRQFGDLDLVVDETEIAAARALLSKEGYQPFYEIQTGEELWREEIQRQCTLIHPQRRTIVELHWSFTPQYFGVSVELVELLRRLVSVQVSGRKLLTFSPEDILIILCIHGYKHRWERLGWVLDIAELMRRNNLDWGAITASARRWHCTRMVSLGLTLAHRVFGEEIPPALAEIDPRNQGARLTDQLMQNRKKDPNTIFSGSMFEPSHLLFLDTWRQRLRYTLRLLFTLTYEDRKQGMPDWVLSMIRPLRLLFKYAGRLSKVVFRSTTIASPTLRG